MDEIENDINEGRKGSEPGEKVWTIPSGHPSPSQNFPEDVNMPSSPVELTLPSNCSERRSLAVHKSKILRFTVTKANLDTVLVNEKSNMARAALNSDAQKQVSTITLC